jgi:hypothetical protein
MKLEYKDIIENPNMKLISIKIAIHPANDCIEF